ncbi:MAG: DNA sulfur modification protein DndE [Nitrososphaerota archaeon]|jgi:DNA sulfur modification protein DndE|nr:DNA sulfur modification protein DndE [Nitrososphaerota archaeon]
MSYNRIRLSKNATVRLSLLKGRTGITPNILCRVGFCLSLRDPIVPRAENYDEDGQEINRYTLTGEWDKFFVALLKERLIKDGLDLDMDFFSQLRAHMNRGAISLYDKVKTLEDFQDLLPGEGVS